MSRENQKQDVQRAPRRLAPSALAGGGVHAAYRESSAQSSKWSDGSSADGYDSHAAAASALLGKGPTALTVQAAARPSPSGQG